jgi:hypothetical protein
VASADLYGPAIAFLQGDAGDIRTSVNAEFASLLAARSVYVSRGGSGKGARDARTPAVTVEIVPAKGEWPSRFVGIGWKEREVVLELRVTSRQKGLRAGATQLDTVEDVARALVARYDEVSNLSLTVTGATFRRSSCRLLAVDDVPESGEYARAIVELRFVFTEPLASNLAADDLPPSTARWSAVTILGSGTYDVQLGDDQALFVVPNVQSAVINVKDGSVSYPVGFSFGVFCDDPLGSRSMNVSADSDHFFDDTGDLTSAVQSSNFSSRGPFIEFVKIQAGKWLAIAKSGTWVAS